MTVGPSLSQRDQNAHQIEARQRLERLRAFSPDQLAAGLIWLSGYDQRTFDAVLDAVEPCAGDGPLGSEPEPVCGICAEKIGIFVRFGLDWRHYRETRDATLAGGQHRLGGTGVGQIELFDPGHAPLVTWCLSDEAAAR
jgi:hypothetical protein